MTTDFHTYTNVGLRHITYNGVDSLTDHGILIADGTSVESVIPRSVMETIPQKQGAIDGSRVDSELFYEPRTLTYKFKIFADTRAELSTKEAAVKAWLNSTGAYRITDSNYTGYEFVNCVLKGIVVEPGEIKSAEYMYLTAVFSCDPYMQKTGTSRQRLTAWAAQGATARAVIDNRVVYPLTWLAIPTVTENISERLIFSIDATAAQQSLRSFYIFGLTSGVTVSNVQVWRGSSTVPDAVTMTAPDRGTLGSVQEDDMVWITYDTAVSAVAVGGTSGGTSYSVTDPLYRLNVLAEGTPTLRINGVSQNIAQSFTLPDTALLAINANTNSYGYYELWHDDTEVRL